MVEFVAENTIQRVLKKGYIEVDVIKIEPMTSKLSDLDP